MMTLAPIDAALALAWLDGAVDVAPAAVHLDVGGDGWRDVTALAITYPVLGWAFYGVEP